MIARRAVDPLLDARPDSIRSNLLIALLVLYPFIAYFIRSSTGINPDYILTITSGILLIELLITRIRTNRTIRIPQYLMALIAFFLYITLSGLFISDQVEQVGFVRFFYSSPIFGSCIILLIIENTDFSEKQIKAIIPALFIILCIAAIVSIIQIWYPLFLVRHGTPFTDSVSQDALRQFYQGLDPTDERFDPHLMRGYHFSIYSWIGALAVGLDSLALFSLLIGLKSIKGIKKGVLFSSAAIISILSSSRWIMLNFFIVSLQTVRGNIIRSGIKYLALAIIFLPVLIYVLSLAGLDIATFVNERLLSASAETRIYAFEVFFKVFPDAPIFGTGGADTPEMLKLIEGRTSQIHVGWLKLLYYYGIVGFIIYLIFIISMLKLLLHRARKSSYWGSLFAFIAFIVANLTLVELSIFYHGLLLAIIFSRVIDLKKQDSDHAKWISDRFPGKVLSPASNHPISI